MKSLEQQLGRVLVVRSKPARPTEAGAAIVRLARQLALLEHDALADFGLGAADDDAAARPVSVPLAVNADSLATWFLPALARVVQRHPVVFDLHRDDQDFTAGLLESGTVMGAVTSQATPVAGCLVRPLGVMRYEAVRRPGSSSAGISAGDRGAARRRSPPRPSSTSTVATTCSASTSSGRGVDPDLPPRHYVPASNDFATAIKLGLGWGLLPAFQSTTDSSAVTSCRSAGHPSTCRCTGSSGTCARRCSMRSPTR